VISLGVTVRAHANRIHELPLQALASYLSQGILNNATGNQGTHCILVRGTQVVDQDNQVAVTTLCEQLSGLASANTTAVTTPTVGIGYYALRRDDVVGR